MPEAINFQFSQWHRFRHPPGKQNIKIIRQGKKTSHIFGLHCSQIKRKKIQESYNILTVSTALVFSTST